MPEKDSRTGSLEIGQFVEGSEHRLPVVYALRQPPLA
jgi:hypothetical protein